MNCQIKRDFNSQENIIAEKNFIGKVIQDVCKLLKVKKGRTTAYHPQSNLVERSHQWLGNYLRSIVDDNPANWDEFLRLAAHANNNTIHTRTRQIPMEALFGFTSHIPVNLKREPEPVYNPDDYPSIFRHKSQVVQQAIRNSFPAIKEKIKGYHDGFLMSTSHIKSYTSATTSTSI